MLRVVLLGFVLVAGLAAAAAAGSPPKSRSRAVAKAGPGKKKTKAKPMPSCAKTVSPADAESLQELIDQLDEGAVLCLSPGTYPVNLVLGKSVTLRGLGQPGEVVLDGTRRASVIKVGGDQPQVVIERLTIRGGDSREGGGGIFKHSAGLLVVREVHFNDNRADEYGGAALLHSGGETTVERCRLQGNDGTVGGALIADYWGKVTVRDTLITGNRGRPSVVYVHQACALEHSHVTIADNQAEVAVELKGIPAQQPSLLARDSIIVAKVAVQNGPRFAGSAHLERCAIGGELVGATLDRGNKMGVVELEGGDDPVLAYRPKAGSLAVGVAKPGSGLDLVGGNPGTTAGAIQVPALKH